MKSKLWLRPPVLEYEGVLKMLQNEKNLEVEDCPAGITVVVENEAQRKAVIDKVVNYLENR